MKARLHAIVERAKGPAALRRPEFSDSLRSTFLLVASAPYHVHELAPIAAELEKTGIVCKFMATRAQPKSVRDTFMRHGRTRSEIYAWPRILSATPNLIGVLVLNDWGPTKHLIQKAQQRGIPTFAKVEGVQDFFDTDTQMNRYPYQQVDFVLAQGLNDLQSLNSSRTTVVGSSRLEAISQAAERSNWGVTPKVVINSNFTYGVLTNERDQWLREAAQAARDVGGIPIISQHPADRPLPRDLRPAPDRMERLLAADADVLVSRFSTVAYESMARGVPFVYCPPAQERVAHFGSYPLRALPNRTSLANCLKKALDLRGVYRRYSSGFFDTQISITETTSGQRSAAAIHQILTTDFLRKAR